MSAAGMSLGTNVATVSRRIERLNERMGSPLFVKTSEGWETTPSALSLIAVIEDFEARLTRETNNFCSGLANQFAEIKIAAPPIVNASILNSATGEFHKAHPRIRMELSDKVQSQGLGDSDIYIRFGRPDRGRIVARRIGRMMFRPYRVKGSRCDAEGWVGLSPRFDELPQSLLGYRVFKTPPTFRVDLFEHKMEVMRATGLPGILPESAVNDDFELVPCDGDHFESECWMGYHQSRRADATIQDVAAWIVNSFRNSRLGHVDEQETEISA